MFKPALIQNYHVSLAGKTKRNDFYFGLTYYNENGTFVNTNYKRFNLFGSSTTHFGLSNTVTNNINISGNMGKSYDYNDVYYAYLNLPWDNPFDSTGKPIYVDQGVPFTWWSRDKINPMNTTENSNHLFKGFDANYDLDLNIKITDWLRYTSTNRVSASFNNSSDYYSPKTAGQYHGTGFLDGTDALSYGAVFNNLLNFAFTFGKHHISGLAGVAYQIEKSQNMGGSGRGLPFNLQVFNVVSSNMALTGFNNESEILSYISQVNYSFEEKYFLTASLRRDGSTAFPRSKRFGYFPAVSGAWIVSNEPFLQTSKVVNNFKIRASYGITGTESIGTSQYLGLFSLASQYNALTAAQPLQLASPNLTWESKHQQDIGVDLGFFHRLTMTLDLYHNVTTNLLLKVSQPLSIGFETRWENEGKVTNNGLELA
ncbi:MAG: SusC/RagA family TonB-linked outer membrane protein, partial [Chitinophagaceae bacterium]